MNDATINTNMPASDFVEAIEYIIGNGDETGRVFRTQYVTHLDIPYQNYELK